MVKFNDGPAVGITLFLRQSPKLIRVVQKSIYDERGEIIGKQFDALDMEADTPTREETVMVYRLVKHHGSAFYDRRSPRGKRTGGLCQIAEYEFYPNQPSTETMMDNQAWLTWRMAEEKTLETLS